MASTGGSAGNAVPGPNAYEEAWVRQAVAESLRTQPSSEAMSSTLRDQADVGRGAPNLWFPATAPALPPAAAPALPALPAAPTPAEDEVDDLHRALAESAAAAKLQDEDQDAAFQRALRESAGAAEESAGMRRLMGAEGPFYPAGLTNSGNSCFWNALLQALFAATPIFRGALFQLDLATERRFGFDEKRKVGGEDPITILGLLRDLFAEMDMGLAGAIDAGELYRKLFQRAEEADVSEQMHKLFDLCAHGPSPLKAVCRELFSGDLYERLQKGSVRRVPLDLCQLDLCITSPAPLERLLEEHTRDVQGSIERRSYRLPPVLWVNLDRFAYDRETQRGKKRQVRLVFPETLNAWMLVPPEAEWVQKLQRCARQREKLSEDLRLNRAETARHSGEGSDEQLLLSLVEQQEGLSAELAQLESHMQQLGLEQELLYQLQAVIVHRGRVDTGHYYAYARSPATGSSDWVCLNDASVSVCSAQEMRNMCEGGTEDEEADLTPPAGTNSRSPTASLGKRPSGGVHSPGVTVSGGSKGLWSSMTSMLGCLPRSSAAVSNPESEDRLFVQEQRFASAKAAAAAPSESRAPARQESKPEAELTAARCLVYVRKGADPAALIEEVRQRVPASLQERIDTRNVEFLRQSAEKVAEEFVQSVRCLTAHAAEAEDYCSLPEAVLRSAERIRREGGMGRARMYLLRACWRARVPWLPEELCPTAVPPDFRMHYGSTAKKMLLDALIKFGQHDVASLIVSGTPGHDCFIPKEMEAWFAAHGV